MWLERGMLQGIDSPKVEIDSVAFAKQKAGSCVMLDSDRPCHASTSRWQHLPRGLESASRACREHDGK